MPFEMSEERRGQPGVLIVVGPAFRVRFLCAQPDGIADSSLHALLDSWPYAIADRETNAISDRRPDAGAHTEVRAEHGPGGLR